MANELQTTTPKPLAVLCSQGLSSYALSSLVDRPYPGIPDRVVDPTERKELARVAGELEQALVPAPQAEIEEAVAMLSLAYPALKATPQEAAGRIALYTRALADIPSAVLQEACMSALKDLKFFPAVSEILERCTAATKARFRLSRIKHLIAKHDREYRPPADERPLTTAEKDELAAIMRRLEAATH